MAMNSKFTFVGELAIPRSFDSFFNERETGQVNIGFNVVEGPQNRGWVEAIGFKNKTIRTRDREGNSIEFDWEDRLDPAVVAEVAPGSKFYVKLGEEFGGDQEFVSKYDMIKYLAENLPNYQGKIIVKGIWEKNAWNGRIKDRFTLTGVYATTPDKPSALNLDMAFFYNADSVDMSDFAKTQRVVINGFTEQYVKAEEKRMLFPQQAILSQASYNMSDEKHAIQWAYKMRFLKENLPKKKKMAHLHWNCRLINGAEEVPFDETMLTDAQKTQIEIGLATLDEFRPRNGVYGEKITEVRLYRPILKGQYTEGIIECEESNEEIESRIFTFEKQETLEEVMKEDVLKEPVVDEDEDDGLF